MREEDENEDQELRVMWGTVRELTSTGAAIVELDGGGETVIAAFWAKYWGHAPETLTIGTRLRCAVSTEWKPTYHVKAILMAVHESKEC